MSFTFDTSVPATGHDPSVDYSVMQANNVATLAILDVDHISFNALAGGTHKQCTFINESNPGIGQGNAALYSNNATVDSQAWPFWTNALGTFQLAGNFQANLAGYFVLPGGIMVQWGAKNGSPGVSTVNFGTPFPNNCYNVFTSLYWDGGSVPGSGTSISIDNVANPPSTTGFRYNWNGSSTNTGFYWLAIGN